MLLNMLLNIIIYILGICGTFFYLKGHNRRLIEKAVRDSKQIGKFELLDAFQITGTSLLWVIMIPIIIGYIISSKSFKYIYNLLFGNEKIIVTKHNINVELNEKVQSLNERLLRKTKRKIHFESLQIDCDFIDDDISDICIELDELESQRVE